MITNNSKYAILLGFIVVMVLTFAIIQTGYQQLNKNNRNLDTVVNNHNVKIDYILTMYIAARERTISLMRMMNLKDSFDRNDEYLHFNTLANRYTRARISLAEFGSDEKEKVFSLQQYKLTKKAVPLLETVAELLINDDIDKASRLFVDKAIPAQNLVLDQLSAMLAYQQLASQKALRVASKSYQDAINVISYLAFAAFIIGLFIVWLIIRQAALTKMLL